MTWKTQTNDQVQGNLACGLHMTGGTLSLCGCGFSFATLTGSCFHFPKQMLLSQNLLFHVW